nr:integrase, catalytic region, zinc finger, CCHC-type, peptidase aspartic, catalytic [Tanacetum cinerariifolium]
MNAKMTDPECVTHKTNIPVPPSTGVNGYPNASGSQPKSNVKPDRISPTKDVNKLPVEDQPRTNKPHLRTSNRVDSSRRYKRTVAQLVLWYLDLGCSKHMMGDRSRLMNFVKKFIGTVRFENDHFGVIMGYEDYVIGDSVMSRKYILVIIDDDSRFTWVKFLRSKDETPEVIIKFVIMIRKLQGLLKVWMVPLVEEEESDHGSSTIQELQTAACGLHETCRIRFSTCVGKESLLCQPPGMSNCSSVYRRDPWLSNLSSISLFTWIRLAMMCSNSPIRFTIMASTVLCY